MKKLILLLLFNSFAYAQVDWSNPNECKLSDHTAFSKAILEKMTLEQKVGQVIMPEINSVSQKKAKNRNYLKKNLKNSILIEAVKYCIKFKKNSFFINL